MPPVVQNFGTEFFVNIFNNLDSKNWAVAQTTAALQELALAKILICQLDTTGYRFSKGKDTDFNEEHMRAIKEKGIYLLNHIHAKGLVIFFKNSEQDMSSYILVVSVR